MQLNQSIRVFIPLLCFPHPHPPFTCTICPANLQLYTYKENSISAEVYSHKMGSEKKRSSHQEGSRLKLNISTNLCYKRREISHTDTHTLSFLLFSPHSNRILSPSVSPSFYIFFPHVTQGADCPAMAIVLCVYICECVLLCVRAWLHFFVSASLPVCVCACVGGSGQAIIMAAAVVVLQGIVGGVQTDRRL